jgi:hypothetical protein
VVIAVLLSAWYESDFDASTMLMIAGGMLLGARLWRRSRTHPQTNPTD